MFLSRRINASWIIVLIVCGCQEQAASPPTHTAAPSFASLPSVDVAETTLTPSLASVGHSPQLVDRHQSLGVLFEFDSGADERKLFVQSTGGGGGWIDYDRDGWQDLILVQGGDPTATPTHPVGDRLFRSHASRHYSDVSFASLPADIEHGQGVAVGDFDNDGFEDLFISNIGPDVLLHNQGDGTFSDLTAVTGMGDRRWGTSSAWFDLDRDGDLDLFVCNYCRYDVFHPVVCRKDDGTAEICHPEHLDGDFSECYENLGDGAFEKVAQKWGLADKPGRALGVIAADLNEDGNPDLFVSNDVMANCLFLGREGGGFSEQAIQLGCAYNSLGQFQANMGVACNDYDGNGFLDLYVTTFSNDSNTLFANLGAGGFRDVTRIEGLHTPTIETLGFGAVMTDLNADGAMDLFIANGHIDDWRYKNVMWKMPPEMFSYQSGQWVKHTAATAGEFLNEQHLGRAVSMADADQDGDSDLLVVNQDESAELLVNESKMGNWLRVECIGRRSNRRGIGAKISVKQGSQTWTQQLIGGSSYLTTHEPSLFFGLGDSTDACEITVRWPGDASPVSVQLVAVNQRVQLMESVLSHSPD